MSTKQSKPVQLSDIQRRTLAAAAALPEAPVALPAHIRGKAAHSLGQALLDRGLVREVRAKGEQRAWRRDASSGRGFTLILTKAGRALGSEQTEDVQEKPEQIVPSEPVSAAASSPAVPRSGSKLAEVIALLAREQGTSVPELMAATGWLPHTTRAALTGLRKRGYTLTREAADQGSRYRISATQAAPA